MRIEFPMNIFVNIYDTTRGTETIIENKEADNVEQGFS